MSVVNVPGFCLRHRRALDSRLRGNDESEAKPSLGTAAGNRAPLPAIGHQCRQSSGSFVIRSVGNPSPNPYFLRRNTQIYFYQFQKRYHRTGFLLLLLTLTLIIGCGSSHTVQPDVAVKTLRTALESWKNGQSPDSLQKASPPIIVQDLDWTSGAKLMEFEILEGGEPVDANLYAQVKLKLRDSAGSDTDRTVTYVVGTSPKLTVFRDMFR